MEDEEVEKKAKKIKDFLRDLSRVLMKHKIMVISHEGAKRGDFKLVPLTKDLLDDVRKARMLEQYKDKPIIIDSMPGMKEVLHGDILSIGSKQAKFKFKKLQQKENG